MLAERSKLSADTIRRLEAGTFSPTVTTLTKLCTGLGLRVSTLFEAFEVGEWEPRAELRDCLELLDDAEASQLLALLSVLRGLLRSRGGEDGGSEGS